MPMSLKDLIELVVLPVIGYGALELRAIRKALTALAIGLATTNERVAGYEELENERHKQCDRRLSDLERRG